MKQDRRDAVTEMDHLEARKIDRMQARVARMSEVSRHMTEGFDLGSVLQKTVDAVRSLANARYGAASVFDESGQVPSTYWHY